MRLSKITGWLIRLKFGLKVDEKFRFANQNSKNAEYFFNKNGYLIKHYIKPNYYRASGVGYDYLLSDECRIIKVGR